MSRPQTIAEMIRCIESNDDLRVLRRVAIAEGPVELRADNVTRVGMVIDVETTGFNPAEDAIIEMAIRRFRFDDEGHISKIDRSRSWREDPGRALSPEITKLTGLRDSDLAGQSIDQECVSEMLQSADLVIAHNASFDRPFVDSRLPVSRESAWSCSMSEIDWPGLGFDGRSLGWLAAQAGWFFDPHQAANDVDAVIALLNHKDHAGLPVLAELVAKAAMPTILFEAIGAGFAVKDELRGRGYRWNARDRLWWREVPMSDQGQEELWLAQRIYNGSGGTRGWGPRKTQLTARERYKT